MSASIGKGSLVLTANAGPLSADLSGAHAKITSWAGRVKSSFGGALAGVGKLAAPIYVAQQAFQAVSGAIGSVVDRVGEIAGISRQTRTLGIDPAEWQALGNVARRVGVELPEFGQMFGKLQAKIAQGGPDTAAALGQIGLSMESLQGMSGKDSLYAIADGLKNTSDAGTRSAVAMKLFEEAGLKLLPMLSKGGAGLRALVDEQKASGAVLSKSQFAVAEAADAAMSRASEAISRVWDKVVIAVAPVVAAIADVAANVIDFLSPAFVFMGDVATGAFRALAITGAYAWDTLKVGGAAVAFGLSMIVDGFGLIFRAIKNVISVAKYLPEFLGGGLAANAAAMAEGVQFVLETTAKNMRGWSESTVNGFGNTADRVRSYFDEVGKSKDDAIDMDSTIGKIQAMTNTVANARGKGPDMGAILKGSKEDYSLRTSFSMGDNSQPVVAAIRVLTGVQQKMLDKMPNREAVSDPITLKDF